MAELKEIIGEVKEQELRMIVFAWDMERALNAFGEMIRNFAEKVKQAFEQLAECVRPIFDAIHEVSNRKRLTAFQRLSMSRHRRTTRRWRKTKGA